MVGYIRLMSNIADGNFYEKSHYPGRKTKGRRLLKGPTRSTEKNNQLARASYPVRFLLKASSIACRLTQKHKKIMVPGQMGDIELPVHLTGNEG